MFSGIRMSDAWLSVYDLMQLRLPAELIALSGCSTGLNAVSAGDEIMGLARGLIRAGAQSALLSLWDERFVRRPFGYGGHTGILTIGPRFSWWVRVLLGQGLKGEQGPIFLAWLATLHLQR